MKYYNDTLIDYSAPPTNELLPMVQGIATQRGVKCALCPKYFVLEETSRANNIKVIKRHSNNCHGNSDLIHTSFVLVQRLVANSTSPYFGVLPRPVVADSPEDNVYQIKRQLNVQVNETELPTNPQVDNSSPSYAMSVLGWDVYSAGIENFASISLLISKCDFGKEGCNGCIPLGFSESIQIIIGELVERVSHVSSNASVFLRRLVMGADAEERADMASQRGRIFTIITKSVLEG
jgi:hypothetical protein